MGHPKLSIIIPAHKEPFLHKTISTLLERSELADRLEVIVIWDGTEFVEEVTRDPRVRVGFLTRHEGMRCAINAGINIAKGEYVMKLDAHCSVEQGFDRVMVENTQDNWVLYPRRYSLNETTWGINTEGRPARDSYFFRFPELTDLGYCLYPATCREWDRKIGLGNILDSMCFEGSCWMVNKKYFQNAIGALDDDNYGPYDAESTEIALNYWLGGGEVKVITDTWYAHLTKRPRHYTAGVFVKLGKERRSRTWSAKHWMNDEHGKPKPFSWLIEKFWPIPGWPDDWQEVWEKNYEVIGDHPGTPGAVHAENH